MHMYRWNLSSGWRFLSKSENKLKIAAKKLDLSHHGAKTAKTD